MKPVRIGERWVGPGFPCLVIAEAGVNHNGEIGLAHRLIDAAVAAGADAVKFQSFVTEELIVGETPKARYQLRTTGTQGGQYGMLKALELTADQQYELKRHCDEAGIIYLCTPYDANSIDRLHQMEIVAFKVASTDTSNIPFLRDIAAKGRPVLLSTGMSTLGEVEVAVEALRKGGVSGRIILLHCTSEYPAPLEEINLLAMLTLQRAFGCPVGFSDHSSGIGASPWAVALGACVIEKHFTVNRDLPGPDHGASLDPEEMTELVRSVRAVESALGDGMKRVTDSEWPNKALMQKSLVARRTIRIGQCIQAEDLACKRPGTGLSPSWLDRIVGKPARRSMEPDHIVELADIDWGT